uniref:Secreted protein n=1 Tax=Trichogramma kaykai TaxID=54128 RepID=A0ABD2VWL4_9HYME
MCFPFLLLLWTCYISANENKFNFFRAIQGVCVYLFDVGPCRARTSTSLRSQDRSRVRKFLKALILIGSANNCIDTACRLAVSVTLIIRFAF